MHLHTVPVRAENNILLVETFFSLSPLSPLSPSLPPTLSLINTHTLTHHSHYTSQEPDICQQKTECARCAKDLQSESTDCDMLQRQGCNADIYTNMDVPSKTVFSVFSDLVKDHAYPYYHSVVHKLGIYTLFQ